MHSALVHVVPSLPLSQEKVCFWPHQMELGTGSGSAPLLSKRHLTRSSGWAPEPQACGSGLSLRCDTCCISPRRTCTLPQWEMQRLLFGDTGQ